MKGWFVQSCTGPVVASWLAVPSWTGRSSEERPDGLCPCQHTLLVAVNSRNLGEAELVRSCCCCRSLCQPPLPPWGWAGDTPRVGPGCLGHLAYGSIPGWSRGVWNCSCGTGGDVRSVAQPQPRAMRCAQGLVALQVSHLWSQCLVLARRSWGPGMRRVQEKPKLEKHPNPLKIQTIPESLEQPGENLNFVEKPSSICYREKLEYCGICDVAINEGLPQVISFAFPKEIKIFSCLGGLLRGTFAHSDVL